MRNVNPPGYVPIARYPGSADVAQAAPAPVQTPAPTQTADGRVPGIDGMLDQVSAALVKQVSADKELQITVGAAAGRALGVVLLEGLFIGWVIKTAWNALPER